MKIVSVPNPVLKQKSQPITKIDKMLVQFIRELERTLVYKKNPEGVGLSGVQVNKLWRLFALYLDHDHPTSVETYINPQIVSASKKMSLGGREDKPFLEGCLSIPNRFGPVWRHQRITLEYQILDLETMTLQPKRKKFESFPARVVQHEIDHLEGVLFTDRALEQNLPIYKEENGELIELSF